jgi:hypothetical protein
MRTTAIGCTIALLLVLAVTAAAASSREVMVEVTSIGAATRPAEERGDAPVELDPRLSIFSKNLKSLFAYDVYTFLGKDDSAVEFGKTAVFKLPEHFSIEVAPEQSEPGGADMIEMLVTLFREKPRRTTERDGRTVDREVVLRTKIRLKNGGTVLLGGPPIRAGVLVLALSARG